MVPEATGRFVLAQKVAQRGAQKVSVAPKVAQKVSVAPKVDPKV